MSMPVDPKAGVQWLFVDEAGDPTLFHGSGRCIVGTEGCSRFFILGRLEVEDPGVLAQALTSLREQLLIHPYFAGVESFRPERKKTATLFHAKDDLPEVRYRVLDLLSSAGKALRFHAVVCDKLALAERERQRRDAEPGYRYQPESIYDGLIRSLFSRLHRLADVYEVCVARRGSRDRTQAIELALEHAERDFAEKFGFVRGGKDAWRVTVSAPRETVCLQAVDYFLWAVQRFYEVRRHRATGEEIREDRFLNMLWPQIDEIHDLDFGPGYGTYFTAQHPLTLEGRFGEGARRRKRS
jgi:Protein of unknown function (DUF3800)